MRQTGPSISPFNALGAAEGAGDAGGAVRRADRNRSRDRRRFGATSENLAADLSRAIGSSAGALVKKQMRAGSTLVGFESRAASRRRFRALNALKIARISNNLGDAKSLVTHPSTTTHQRLTRRRAPNSASAKVLSDSPPGSNIATT